MPQAAVCGGPAPAGRFEARAAAHASAQRDAAAALDVVTDLLGPDPARSVPAAHEARRRVTSLELAHEGLAPSAQGNPTLDAAVSGDRDHGQARRLRHVQGGAHAHRAHEGGSGRGGAYSRAAEHAAALESDAWQFVAACGSDARRRGAGGEGLAAHVAAAAAGASSRRSSDGDDGAHCPLDHHNLARGARGCFPLLPRTRLWAGARRGASAYRASVPCPACLCGRPLRRFFGRPAAVATVRAPTTALHRAHAPLRLAPRAAPDPRLLRLRATR